MGRLGRFRCALLLGAAVPAWLCLAACGPARALDELRGDVLFYPWTHGASMSDDPGRVAQMNASKIRSLREIEAFSGPLAEWKERTSPVTRIRVGPSDFVIDRNIFFYYLASLRRPAVTGRLRLHITRIGPDGGANLDLVTGEPVQINRRAQSGGMLFSMAGLPPGDHRLHLELLEGDELAASGDLWVEYRPGPSGSSAPLAARGESPRPGAVS